MASRCKRMPNTSAVRFVIGHVVLVEQLQAVLPESVVAKHVVGVPIRPERRRCCCGWLCALAGIEGCAGGPPAVSRESDIDIGRRDPWRERKSHAIEEIEYALFVPVTRTGVMSARHSMQPRR